MSFPRTRESRKINHFWTPAFAGVTALETFYETINFEWEKNGMTKKEFFRFVSNGYEDVVQIFLDTLSSVGVDYCVIGGLAVNAYAEPVVSLDLDIVVSTDDIRLTRYV